MAKKKKIVNCLGCGRDTSSKSGYCRRCIGEGHRFTGNQINDTKDRKRNTLVAEQFESAEDDYSEESNANSIYVDGRVRQVDKLID